MMTGVGPTDSTGLTRTMIVIVNVTAIETVIGIVTAERGRRKRRESGTGGTGAGLTRKRNTGPSPIISTATIGHTATGRVIGTRSTARTEPSFYDDD